MNTTRQTQYCVISKGKYHFLFELNRAELIALFTIDSSMIYVLIQTLADAGFDVDTTSMRFI